MAYQSIDGAQGDSDSVGKLAAIGLPDLAGKSFLDIGCNEGYFCGEALRRGAIRVVGIEKVPTIASAAQARFPDAVILNQTWDNLPNEQFDVIVMLSALHYEKQPRDLMRRIYDRLAPDGLLILEVGVVHSNDYFYLQSVRSVGTVLYPTTEFLIDYTLEDFAVREIGPSVNQQGDNVQRMVYHCTRRTPTYLLVGGPSGTGKTNLLYSLRKRGLITFSTDQYIVVQHRSQIPMENPQLTLYFQDLTGGNGIGDWIDGIRTRELASAVAKLVFDGLPKEADVVFVEGYMFCNFMILDEILKLFAKAGLRAWHTTRAV